MLADVDPGQHPQLLDPPARQPDDEDQAFPLAVGGTDLNRADTPRGWTEQAWSGTSSGCAAYVAKPVWQHDPNCPTRTVADVSNMALYKTDQGGGSPSAAPVRRHR